MYRSNGTSSMATLMQQTNCIKTLANGGLGTDPVGVSDQQLVGSDTKPTTRTLLPHEMASLPSSMMTQQHQTPAPPHQYNNNFGYYNNSHHHHSSHHTNHLHPHQNLNNASPAIASSSSVVHTSNHTSSSSSHLPHILQNSHHHHHSHTTSSSNTSHSATQSQTSASDMVNGHASNDLDRLADGSCPADTNQSPATNAETDANAMATAGDDAEQEPEPEIDIVINNVVCSFSVRCHLNLREIALNGVNVEFRRENGMVTMKLRRPYTTASIWSSGRITCTGATSEDQAKVAARRYARCLQKLGFSVRFNNFRVVNVLGTCSMPWSIKIVNFSEKYKKDASYEPELHPGVTYKLKWPKATLKIFSTGSITVTASSVNNVQAAIEHIFPLVYEFRKKRAADDPKVLKAAALAAAAAAAKEAAESAAASAEAAKSGGSTNDKESSSMHQDPLGHASNDPTDDIMYVSDGDEDMVEEDYLNEDDDEEELL